MATAENPPGIENVLDGEARDLGGFVVRRVLPAKTRRMVGPFIFFDHLGPVTFEPGAGMDVRPHPHIGLATVTYLFEGEIVHRDSLGSEQAIRPGDINWMTAGHGIVHSERTSAELRRTGSRSQGLQLWVALPTADEEVAPSFRHHPGASLPEREIGGVRVRTLAGSAYGLESPVETRSPLFYVDASMPAGSVLPLPAEHAERAVYVAEGAVECGAARAEVGRMLIFTRDATPPLRATENARVVLVGGAPLEGRRYIDWNFVSSSKDRIEQARRDWKGGRFPKVPGDEVEFIPLPSR